MGDRRHRSRPRRGRKATAMSLLLTSQLLRSPAKYRLPVSTEAAAERFVWQAEVLPNQHAPGNPIIQLELHLMEKADAKQFPEDGVAPEILSFVKNGEVDYGATTGKKEFVDPSTLENFTPEVFCLQSTFHPDDLKKPKILKNRLQEIVRRRNPRPSVIRFSWAQLQASIERAPALFLPRTKSEVDARWMQAVKREDGTCLVLALLPDTSRLDEHDGKFYVPKPQHHDKAGLVVWVDAAVVQHLLDVVPHIINDGDDFVGSFYRRLMPEPANPFAEADELYDKILEGIRGDTWSQEWLKDQMKLLEQKILLGGCDDEDPPEEDEPEGDSEPLDEDEEDDPSDGEDDSPDEEDEDEDEDD